MTTMLSLIDSTRLMQILQHKDITRETYTAYCTDKFVLWHDFKPLQDLIRVVEEDCEVLQFTGKDVADRYTGLITLMQKMGRCTIVPSAVDCVVFDTDVRTFTSKQYKIQLHMKLYGQPLIHPKYGEHIGWTASVLEV
jgi:hypothetical protein